MVKIKEIKAYWTINSRGQRALEVCLYGEKERAFFSSPSGASKGKKEAIEKPIDEAIKIVERIKKEIIGKELSSPKEFDELLISLDGTKNKERIGGNVATALSIAFIKLLSKEERKEPWEIIGETYFGKAKLEFPKPMLNFINGGKHASNNLSIQEFLIVGKREDVEENLSQAVDIYKALKEMLKRKGKSIAVGDEGGFSASFREEREALEYLSKAIEEAGGDVEISLDAAADSFYKAGRYLIEGKELSSLELVDYYVELSKTYSLYSIEDPFFEEDIKGFKELKSKGVVKIIGDDLIVSDKENVEKYKSIIDGGILKPNQRGTIKEIFMARKELMELNKIAVVSHRSGDNEDSILADISIGLRSEFIKTGAVARGERTAKYNRLLRLKQCGEHEG